MDGIAAGKPGSAASDVSPRGKERLAVDFTLLYNEHIG